MKRSVFFSVLLLVAFLGVMIAATPVAAYHYRYFHPVWGWGWHQHYPYYVAPYYPPAVYVPPPVVIPQPAQPLVQPFVQRPTEQAQSPQQQQVFWYWCNNPQGFWPHIQKCENDAWMQVLPQTAPPTAAPRQ